MQFSFTSRSFPFPFLNLFPLLSSKFPVPAVPQHTIIIIQPSPPPTTPGLIFASPPPPSSSSKVPPPSLAARSSIAPTLLLSLSFSLLSNHHSLHQDSYDSWSPQQRKQQDPSSIPSPRLFHDLPSQPSCESHPSLANSHLDSPRTYSDCLLLTTTTPATAAAPTLTAHTPHQTYKFSLLPSSIIPQLFRVILPAGRGGDFGEFTIWPFGLSGNVERRRLPRARRSPCRIRPWSSENCSWHGRILADRNPIEQAVIVTQRIIPTPQIMGLTYPNSHNPQITHHHHLYQYRAPSILRNNHMKEVFHHTLSNKTPQCQHLRHLLTDPTNLQVLFANLASEVAIVRSNRSHPHPLISRNWRGPLPSVTRNASGISTNWRTIDQCLGLPFPLVIRSILPYHHTLRCVPTKSATYSPLDRSYTTIILLEPRLRNPHAFTL